MHFHRFIGLFSAALITALFFITIVYGTSLNY
jgi:hypothetical protein